MLQLRRSNLYLRATLINIFHDAYNYLLIAKMHLIDVARGTELIKSRRILHPRMLNQSRSRCRCNHLSVYVCPIFKKDWRHKKNSGI